MSRLLQNDLVLHIVHLCGLLSNHKAMCVSILSSPSFCPVLDNGRDNKILGLLFCLFGFRMFGKELTMYGINMSWIKLTKIQTLQKVNRALSHTKTCQTKDRGFCYPARCWDLRVVVCDSLSCLINFSNIPCFLERSFTFLWRSEKQWLSWVLWFQTNFLQQSIMIHSFPKQISKHFPFLSDIWHDEVLYFYGHR